MGGMNYSDPFLDCAEWRSVRMMVLERDGAKCACCGATAETGAVMNVDHIKPRRRYPQLALTLSNLQVLCDACNHGKGNRSERDWRHRSEPVQETSPTDAERARRRTLSDANRSD